MILKRMRAWSLKVRTCITVLLATLLATSTGCVSNSRIRFVDSQTGQAVEGVNSVWRQDVQDLLFGVHHKGPVDLGASDGKGVIEMHGLHPTWVSRFVFTHPMYVAMYGVYQQGCLTLAATTEPRVPDEHLLLTGTTTSCYQTNGLFTVRLSKKP